MSQPAGANLPVLQEACSRSFGMTPAHTLGLLTDLYEDRFISYPRTESRLLPASLADRFFGGMGRAKLLRFFDDPPDHLPACAGHIFVPDAGFLGEHTAIHIIPGPAQMPRTIAHLGVLREIALANSRCAEWISHQERALLHSAAMPAQAFPAPSRTGL